MTPDILQGNSFSEKSLPKEFLNRMKEILKEDYPPFLSAFSGEPFASLRVNTLKGDVSTFFEKAKGCGLDTPLSPIAWEEAGFYYDGEIRFGKHPFHEAGVYYIQEASAMAPVTFLDVSPGDRVLDLCAAPGGKSTQLACRLNGEGLLVSNEIHPSRAKILSENIERMGIANAMVTNEAPAALAERFPLYFDRILVDAPCSGEGMFRKNEEAIRQWSPENVALCADRQDEILDAAAEMLRPGGRMVYSTCTFAPEENEGSVLRFLRRHPDFRAVKPQLAAGMSPGNPDWYDALCTDAERDAVASTVRLFPHRINGEGHFAAVLEKEGQAERIALPPAVAETLKTSKKKGRADGKSANKGISDAERICLLQEFSEQTLAKEIDGRLVFFGDRLYAVPLDFPPADGLKVLRYGLSLGSFERNRFEPSHSLALSLKPCDVKRSCELSALSADAATLACRFIAGETFPFAGENGWYLISLCGYSLGWGRCANNMMKNYYPKGLRKSLL